MKWLWVVTKLSHESIKFKNRLIKIWKKIPFKLFQRHYQNVMNIYSFPLFLFSITWLSMCWSHDCNHFVISFTLLIIPIFHLIYAYHIPILSHYYLGSSFLLSYASIFHLICTASYLFDYLCTFYILSYCPIFCSLPIGHSIPLISWHCSSLSFLLSSEYSLRSYW